MIYLNRQKTGRRLDEESHESLVEALEALEEGGVCELQIVRMEEIGLREQIRLVSRSTVSLVYFPHFPFLFFFFCVL